MKKVGVAVLFVIAVAMMLQGVVYAEIEAKDNLKFNGRFFQQD